MLLGFSVYFIFLYIHVCARYFILFPIIFSPFLYIIHAFFKTYFLNTSSPYPQISNKLLDHLGRFHAIISLLFIYVYCNPTNRSGLIVQNKRFCL